MTVKTYISPAAEPIGFSLEDNFAQTTGGGTGEPIDVTGPEEDW